MTLDERKALALDLRKKGYNCAQSVVLAFPELTGSDADLIARMTSGLGSGVAGSKEICGVITGMSVARGIRESAAPEGKAASAKACRVLMDEFAAQNGGRVRCADLKGQPGIKPCNELVLQGVEILHKWLEESSRNNDEDGR